MTHHMLTDGNAQNLCKMNKGKSLDHIFGNINNTDVQTENHFLID